MLTYNPSRILYGPDFRMLLAEAAIGPRLGKHALLVTNEELVRDGTVPVLREGLEDEGVESILFDRINDDTAGDVIDEVSSLASNGRADYLIGIGPPLVLDLAKIVSVTGGSGKRVYRLVDQPEESWRGEGLPFLAVPTRCWNPLLFSELAVITDARESAAKPVHTSAYPDSVYYLSGILESLTGKQVVYDLLCIICDCIEAMVQAEGSVGYPLVLDAIEKAVSILRAIPTADTPPDRGKIQVAGIHSAWFFPSPGAGFALGRSAHSRTGVSPEWVTAALLPEVGGYFAGRDRELNAKLRRILDLELGEELGGDVEEIEMEIRSLTALADVPLRLRDLGLDFDRLAGIAGCAAGICDIEEEALLGLLNTAL